MSRYQIISPWTVVETAVVETFDGSDTVTVKREVADIKDTKSYFKDEYHQGAFRVSAKTEDGKTYQGKHVSGRSKTFYGELAWSNSERLFGDLVNSGRFDR